MRFDKVVEGDQLADAYRGSYQWLRDDALLIPLGGSTVHPIAESGLRHPEAPGGREDSVCRSVTDIDECGLRSGQWLVVPREMVEGLPPII